jgi:hypothetical protein
LGSDVQGALSQFRTKVTGGCHCGNILVDIELARASDTYNPRACDCDFCSKHAAWYVSDPHGSLLVRIKDARDSRLYRQGSGIADCLLCRNCGVLIGVLYRGDEQLHAAVNARAVEAKFGAELAVSPKKLSDSEKVKRWQDLWFPNVSIINVDT